MAQAPTLQVTLSEEAFEFVQQKVASGEFASESDVLMSGIEVLRDRQEQIALWEREVVVAAYDRLKADPSSAIPLEEVERDLAQRRQLRSKAS
jgi:Arc/MetJ-type ribon-helix-helix transcriptional regulator